MLDTNVIAHTALKISAIYYSSQKNDSIMWTKFYKTMTIFHMSNVTFTRAQLTNDLSTNG